VKQKERADQGDDDELLEELACQVLNLRGRSSRAVIGRDDFDALWADDRWSSPSLASRRAITSRALAPAHDDDAASDFALAIQFCDAAAHLRTDLDPGDIAKGYRRTLAPTPRGMARKSSVGAEIAAGPHHMLGFAHLDRPRRRLPDWRRARRRQCACWRDAISGHLSGSRTIWYWRTIPPIEATSATPGTLFSSNLNSQSWRLRSSPRSWRPVRSTSAY
jgi:hypothetical protein